MNRKEEKIFRKESSVVFQDPRTSLNPRLTVYKIIEEPLIVHGVERKEREERIIKAINDAGLDETFLSRYPSELSGDRGRELL